MKSAKNSHEWSKEALLAKSQRYSDIMLAQDRDSWLFAFWSALTLEMLVRAAFSNISPALVADNKDWNNVLYALGHQPSIKKFSPKSNSIASLLNKANGLIPKFTQEMSNFAILHLNRRNSEVHGGALPFDDLETKKWLPEFYQVSEVLLKSLKSKLSILFGEAEAKTAKALIKGIKDSAAKIVEKKISNHKKIWLQKSPSDKEKLSKQATLMASRHLGHRVKCPACSSDALLMGDPTGTPTIKIDDQEVIVKTPMLPGHFECSACQLKVSGYSKLNACGLGGVFTSTSTFDASEYFGEPVEEEHYYDDDNND